MWAAGVVAAVLVTVALVTVVAAHHTLEPRGYRLDLHPDHTNNTYHGRVRIDLVNKGADAVTQIELDVVESVETKDKEIKLIKLANDDDSDEESEEDEPIIVSSAERKGNHLVLGLSQSLHKDSTYQLDIHFEGVIHSDNSKVFFRDNYFDQATGETRWFLTLSPELNNIHEVFPCFDQPTHKSWFEISVTHKHGLIALSNSPVMEKANVTKDGMVRTQFSRTPLMSINSIGLFISDFKMPQVEYLQTDGIKMGVWGRADFASALSKAQQLLPSVLVSLELYLSRPYPLQHLNLIALPGYIGSRPRNSWGLQWFKESDLMNSNSYWLSQRLAKAAAMQWLGHLATPVNESLVTTALANFLANLVAKQLEPSVYSWSLSSFHTIVLELGKHRVIGLSPDQLSFLTETKASLLMQMLEEVFGPQTFKQGVQNFLAKKEFKTYSENELWQVLTEQAWADKKLSTSLTLGEITKPWLKKNIPLITVTTDYKKNITTFTQEEFCDGTDGAWLGSKVVKKGGVEASGWWVPAVVSVAQGPRHVAAWLPANQHSVSLTNLSTKADLLLNPASQGAYLVNYDTEGWNRLRESMGSQPADVRAQMVHDSLTLALSGHLPADMALNVSSFLSQEQSPEVWRAFFPLAERLRKRFQGGPAATLFDTFIRRLLIPVSDALGEEDKYSWKTELRLKTRHLLCEAGYGPCVDTARTIFATWVNASHPDEAIPISSNNLCPVMAWGTYPEWEFALDRLCNFPKNRSRTERTFLLKTIAGCPKDPSKYPMLINRTFFDDNYGDTFTDEDRFMILSAISGETVGYNALFEMLKAKWDDFKSRLQPNLWEFLLQTALGSFRTEEGLKQVKELVEEKKGEFGSGEKLGDEIITRVECRVRWSRENFPLVETWLRENMPLIKVQEKFKFQEVVVASHTDNLPK